MINMFFEKERWGSRSEPVGNVTKTKRCSPSLFESEQSNFSCDLHSLVTNCLSAPVVFVIFGCGEFNGES